MLGEGHEQFRVDLNPPSHLRQFVGEAQRVQRVIAREFRIVRIDALSVNPPIAIFNNGALDRMVKPTLAVPIAKDALCAYQPLINVIHVSEQLVQGDDLLRRTLGLAEELTHAQTTRDFGDSVRVAYATFPYPRVSSQLTPGAIYDLTEHQFDSQAEGESITVKGDSDKVLLLERTTLLALHLMLDSLLNDRYPLLVLIRGKKPEATIMKDRQLLADVLGSMYFDNLKLLPRNLLSLFQDPRPIDWASSTMSRDKKSDMVTMRL